jgi:hypothetical protein
MDKQGREGEGRGEGGKREREDFVVVTTCRGWVLVVFPASEQLAMIEEAESEWGGGWGGGECKRGLCNGLKRWGVGVGAK